MRIGYRTPPVRLAARRLAALAALPPEYAGLLLRWGMERYLTGRGVPVDRARMDAALDERGWRTMLHVAAAEIDVDALASGTIVVVAFAEASDHGARVSASRVRAPVRAAEEVSVQMAVNAPETPTGRDRGGVGARPTAPAAPAAVRAAPVDDGRRSAPAPATTRPSDRWPDIADDLVARGVDRSEVDEAIGRWRGRYGVHDVVEAVGELRDRRIARPLRYLERVLENEAAARRTDLPAGLRLAHTGGALPRRVRRVIQVAPRSGWTFEGWTARGDRHGGPSVAERREVWRTEAGKLSYRPPSDPATIPTYEEDPGVYEAD